MEISNISSILESAAKYNASDVHLMANQPPIFRIYGELKAVEGLGDNRLTPIVKYKIAHQGQGNNRKQYEDHVQFAGQFHYVSPIGYYILKCLVVFENGWPLYPIS